MPISFYLIKDVQKKAEETEKLGNNTKDFNRMKKLLCLKVHRIGK